MSSKRDRAYYRYQRRRHIDRKKRIIHEQNDYWYYEHEGSLSKGKISCSCGMCSSKTRNKGKRRHVHGNYSPSLNWKHSDEQKIESMKDAETEVSGDFDLDPAWQ